MSTTLFYFLQVIICSAVLYGYYLVGLKNKRFHQYNRVYLLLTLLLSWLIPLISIPVKGATATTPTSRSDGFHFFEVIADNKAHLEEYFYAKSVSFTWDTVLTYGYWIPVAVIATAFVAGILRMLFLLRRHDTYRIAGILIVPTSDKAAPFSFFNCVFWNKEIDIHSPVGKQILVHEMVHVQQKHTIDKLISAVVLSLGWFNPVFWLARRELNMVHEFIADQKTVNNDASELANMLLTASYPSASFRLTNSFFHSPIKRRISIMTNLKINRYAYLRKLMVLPIFGIVIMLFAFRKQVTGIVVENSVFPVASVQQPLVDTPRVSKPLPASEHESENTMQPVALKRSYRVAFEPGHGGYDGGAIAKDGTKESDFTLEFAKTLAEENKNDNIILVFSRWADAYQHPKTKLELMKMAEPDVFVSLHAAHSDNEEDSGVELYVPSSDSLAHYKSSYLFANTLANTINDLGVRVQIKQRQTGTWIINSADRPAVLIEAGFLSNKSDLKKLKDKNHQRQLARSILKGIGMYLQQRESAD